jgi:hypothetical protein
MTRYPHSPDSLVTSDRIDSELASEDALDWESRMARLVGLAEDSPLTNSEESAGARERALSSESPQEPVVVEQSFSSNPFAKLSLVAAGTLSIVLFAGGFLSQIMNVNHPRLSQQNLVTSEESFQPKSESEELATEVEVLKTKLALSEQTESVKEAQQMLRSRQTGSGEVRTADRTPLPARVVRTETVYVPRIVTVERIVKVPQPSLPMRRSPTTTQPHQSQGPATLAKSGNQDREPAHPQQTVPAILAPVDNPPVTTPAPLSTLGQMRPLDPPLANQGEPREIKSVAAGNSVKAVLATAAFGETTMSKTSDQNDEEKNVFVVRLLEPLKATDGTIALPENTELLTEIRSLSEQGWLQLNVVKVILNNKGNPTERSLPHNTMIVRAPQGKPLIASQFPNQSSSITGMDLGLFILGGLGKAAELINQTQSQIVTTTGTGTIISNTNPQPNILAGALDGGINTLVPQIAQRNQQAIAQMMQRTNIWFLPAGTEVEVYVNQLLQF